MRNEIRTGCGSCPFNLNGDQCSNPEKCYGCYQKPQEDFKNTVLGIENPVQFTTHCLVYGEEVAVNDFEGGPKICDGCRDAILWAKMKMNT